LVDDATYTYFQLFQGNRESVNRCFIPTIELNEDDFSQEIADLDERVDAAEGNIEAVQGETIALTNRVDYAEENINNIQISLGEAQSNILTLTTGLGEAQSNISTLQTDLGTAQSDISTLQTDLDNKIDRVKNQNGKIPKLNTTGNLEATSIEEATINGKIDKVTGYNKEIARFTEDGNLEPTGKDISFFIPTGVILMCPLETIPTGWLECNGQVISRTTYANLFSKIGTIYGAGDGSTTFKIPDMRGLFVRGFDHLAGVDPDSATRTDRGDGMTGDRVGTKQEDELKSHPHSIAIKGQSTSTGNMPACTNDNQASGNFNTGNAGGNETRPKNIYMMFIIKV
jgi:microcystin-dependent protein